MRAVQAVSDFEVPDWRDEDGHTWSGWPGAFCMRCGDEDQTEVCVARHNVLLYCAEGCWVPDEKTCGHEAVKCSEHRNRKCPG